MPITKVWLFGWWKSRLISADLIVPYERKQAKTSRNKPGKDKRTGPIFQHRIIHLQREKQRVAT